MNFHFSSFRIYFTYFFGAKEGASVQVSYILLAYNYSKDRKSLGNDPKFNDGQRNGLEQIELYVPLLMCVEEGVCVCMSVSL